MRTFDSDIDEESRVKSTSLTENGVGGQYVVLLFIDRDLEDKNKNIKML